MREFYKTRIYYIEKFLEKNKENRTVNTLADLFKININLLDDPVWIYPYENELDNEMRYQNVILYFV